MVVRRRWIGTRALLALVTVTVAAACSTGRADVVAQRSDQIPTPTTVPTTTILVPSDEPDGQQSTVDPSGEPAPTLPPDDSPPPDGSSPPAPSMPSTSEEDEQLSADQIDELLTELAANGFCDPADVRDDGIVTAMHFVVRGELQPPCYVDQLDDGEDVDPVVVDDDPRLLAAWESLVSITPIELVSEVSLLAGYEPCSTCDTLAFVTTLDEDFTFFLLAVDVVSGTSDPDELRLTMMHELTHVFAQRPEEQLDVAVRNAAGCDTFFNGAGCFTGDSYLWAWIEEFWPPEILGTLPADGSVGSDAEAGERCDLDDGFIGSYAAVHPEEDFAETFSAYVYDVPVGPGLAEKYAFFDRYPEFVAIRDNARALGLDVIEGSFGGCG